LSFHVSANHNPVNLAYCLTHTTFSQDSKWWSADYTPTSSAEEDTESDTQEEEEEGELDSLGRLFLNLLNSEAPNPGPSADNPAHLIPGPSDPASDVLPGPQPAAPTPLKRTRAAIAKVPLSRFSTCMMNSSQTQAQTQEKEAEKEAEANKKPRTRSSSAHVSLSSGIPQRPLSSWAKSIQKTPSKKYPLAGKIRVPKRSRLSDSSSDAVSTPEDFHINTGLEMLHYLFFFNT